MKSAATARSRLRKPETPNEYLARVPEPARSTLENVRAALRSALPAEAVETISYGIPAFRTDRVLVWYAAFSKHCSLFPTASVIKTCRDELARYTVSKGTVQFPIDKPLPASLIKKLMKSRLAQIVAKEKR